MSDLKKKGILSRLFALKAIASCGCSSYELIEDDEPMTKKSEGSCCSKSE